MRVRITPTATFVQVVTLGYMGACVKWVKI